MATVLKRRIRTPFQLATTASRLCRECKCDTREFDNCFEQGNGEEVVAEYMKLYEKDDYLRYYTELNSFYINLDAWRATAARVAAQRLSTPLFPVSSVA